MTLDQEAITNQFLLLAAHRRTLTALLQQQALLGGTAYASPGILNGIVEAREAIRRIKTTLRENGVQVEDEPDDDAPVMPSPEIPTQSPSPVQQTITVQDESTISNVSQRTINTQGGDYAE